MTKQDVMQPGRSGRVHGFHIDAAAFEKWWRASLPAVLDAWIPAGTRRAGAPVATQTQAELPQSSAVRVPSLNADRN